MDSYITTRTKYQEFLITQNITLTFTFGGNWLRYKYKTSSVESSTVQHLDSVRVARQSDQNGAKFEISPVWSQINPGLRYAVSNNYSSWLIYCSAVYSYLIPTNSMEQSPFWQTNSSSGNRDICHMLRNRNVHYRRHNKPSPLSVLTQLM
jgi:hypothetical protein